MNILAFTIILFLTQPFSILKTENSYKKHAIARETFEYCDNENNGYNRLSNDSIIEARFTYYSLPGEVNTIRFHDISRGNAVKWIWDFGDGCNGNTQNPEHTYQQSGIYDVCLIVMKPNNESDTLCKSIETELVTLCHSSFSAYTDPLDYLTIHFIEHSQGNTDLWLWDFGDGNFSVEKNPHHTYCSTDIYNVILTTTSTASGCENSYQKTIYVNSTPTYNAHYHAYQLKENELTFRFVDHSTGFPYQWFWDFDDGTISELENPIHSFIEPGIYNVCLTIKDYENEVIDLYCSTIFAGIASECNSFFQYSSDEINERSYHFFNASSKNAVQFEWDFGDGNFSSEKNPSHSFNADGYYLVCLKITSSDGFCTDTFCDMIQVKGDLALQSDFIAMVYPQDLSTIQFINKSSGRYSVKIWDFGDGTTSCAADPAHNYASAGIYNVCLHLEDETTNISHQHWKTVEVGVPIDCEADFYSFSSVENPFFLKFACLSSGEITQRYWDFNDGNSSSLKNPIHLFTSGGNFNICLDIIDFSGNCTDENCKDLFIDYEELCKADFDYLPPQDISLAVEFNDLSSGIMNTWHWDFGDGNTSQLRNPVHSYADSGLYQVTLSVQNTDSLIWCNHSTTKQVPVYAPPLECFADFSVYPDSAVNKPNLFHFKNLSLGAPDSLLWIFNDGYSTTEKNPVHQFENFGEHQVTLFISKKNPFGEGCSDSKTLSFSSPDYFHIGGFVYAGSFPINNPMYTGDTAEILLYRFRENNIIPLDTAKFVEYGYYHALYLLQDHYLIKSQLTKGSTNFKNYFPSYYDNDLTWQNAEICHIADSNHYHLDIRLGKVHEMDEGLGTIFGNAYFILFRNEIAIPAGNTVVLLLDEQKHPINFRFTQNQGTFLFEQIPFGTYYLMAESAGKKCQSIMIELTAENPNIKDVQLELYDQGATAVNEIPLLPISQIKIFPNPAKDNLNLTFSALANSSITTSIFDISGRKSYFVKHLVAEGTNLIIIPTGNLRSGVYFLQVKDESSGIFHMMKFVK